MKRWYPVSCHFFFFIQNFKYQMKVLAHKCLCIWDFFFFLRHLQLILFSTNMNLLKALCSEVFWLHFKWFVSVNFVFCFFANNRWKSKIFKLQKFYSKTFRSRNSPILNLQGVKWTFGHSILMSCITEDSNNFTRQFHTTSFKYFLDNNMQKFYNIRKTVPNVIL